jgi:hypothetical protein
MIAWTTTTVWCLRVIVLSIGLRGRGHDNRLDINCLWERGGLRGIVISTRDAVDAEPNVDGTRSVNNDVWLQSLTGTLRLCCRGCVARHSRSPRGLEGGLPH